MAVTDLPPDSARETLQVPAPELPLSPPDVERVTLQLAPGLRVTAAVAAAAPGTGCAFLPPYELPDGAGTRGALFLLVEGVPAESAAELDRVVREQLMRDRGTPASRLLRAVSAACRRLERQALHRFELSSLGFSALLIDQRHACLAQLPPCQAYIASDDGLRLLPEEQVGRSDQVAGEGARHWELEFEITRVALWSGMAILLCPSIVAQLVASSSVARWLRLGPEPAARRCAGLDRDGHRSRRGRRHGAQRSLQSIVVGITAAPAPPVAPIVAISRSVPRRTRAAPAAPNDPDRQLVRAPVRIEAWGLRRTRGGTLPLLGRLLAWVDAPPELVPARRYRPPAPVVAGAGALCVAAAIWLGVTGGIPRAVAPPADEAAPPHVEPTGLAGQTVLIGERPLAGLAVAETSDRTVFVLDIAARIGTVAGGALVERRPAEATADIAHAGLIAARAGEAFWLDRHRALWQVSGATGEVRPVALRGAGAWRRPVALAFYAGNLYVLDAGGAPAGAAGQIWRHSATPGGFEGEPQSWLQPSLAPLLGGAAGFAIDGAIWVLREDGQVLRFALGRAEPFEIHGLETPIQTGGAIYTEAGFRSLYVVDAATRRLVQLAKNGQFERAVGDVFPIGEHVRSLWVDEATGRALVLTDQRLLTLHIPR